ncbi:MAG: hypothetical protein ACYC75_01555 [Minisyncoccota bacterium]
MENLQFNEDSQYVRPAFNSEKRSWLANLVIKARLAKDDAGAQKVLLVVLIFVVLATVAVLWMSNAQSSPSPLPPSSQLIIKSEIPADIKNEIPSDVFNSLPAEFYPKDLPQSTIEQLPSTLRQQLGI